MKVTGGWFWIAEIVLFSHLFDLRYITASFRVAFRAENILITGLGVTLILQHYVSAECRNSRIVACACRWQHRICDKPTWFSLLRGTAPRWSPWFAPDSRWHLVHSEYDSVYQEGAGRGREIWHRNNNTDDHVLPIHYSSWFGSWCMHSTCFYYPLCNLDTRCAFACAPCTGYSSNHTVLSVQYHPDVHLFLSVACHALSAWAEVVSRSNIYDSGYLYRANVFEPHKNVTITAVIAMIE